eukprot:364970-Chlamydomonas_euryale.AAC.7
MDFAISQSEAKDFAISQIGPKALLNHSPQNSGRQVFHAAARPTRSHIPNEHPLQATLPPVLKSFSQPQHTLLSLTTSQPQHTLLSLTTSQPQHTLLSLTTSRAPSPATTHSPLSHHFPWPLPLPLPLSIHASSQPQHRPSGARTSDILACSASASTRRRSRHSRWEMRCAWMAW